MPREDGYDITVASEIMAVLCLASDIKDLKERLSRIIIGYTYRMLLKDLNERTRPCFVKEEGKFVFRIILTQGLNRQIRRMCKTLGYGVLSIKRVRVANILLGKLNPGDIRAVTGAELKELDRKSVV